MPQQDAMVQKYAVQAQSYVWDGSNWVAATQAGGGGAGGGLTDAELRATPVPVSGTFYQATQPVSLASMPSTPVTGTFWQTTQPVSGPLTDAQLRAAAVPVSGTFWQPTQPVSGTFWQATQPVSAASLPLPAGASTEATLSTLNGKVTACNTGAVTISAALPAGANAIGKLAPNTGVNIGDVSVTAVPALTKGTQGATGLTVQDLKDAGRQSITLCWEEMAGTANVESALTNFTSGQRGGTALGAASSLTVTTGKTLRLQAITGYIKATSTVNNLGKLRIRQAASVANNSPVLFDRVLSLEVTGTIAAGAFHDFSMEFPDGLEVAAGQQITFTWNTAATTCTVGLTIIGYEY